LSSDTYLLTTVNEYVKYFSARVMATVDGSGFQEYGLAKSGNDWLHCHSTVLRRKSFVRAVHLRFNALPCRHNSQRFARSAKHLLAPTETQTDSASILRNARVVPARCRYKCGHVETIDHITQSCYHTQRARTVMRHDALVTDIVTFLSKKGITVQKEKTFTTSEGERYRPDIVAVHDGKLWVLDVTCPFERKSPLENEAQNKKAYYSRSGIREAIAIGMEFSPALELASKYEAVGLVFGARGAVSKSTELVLNQVFRVPLKRINLWCELTIYRTLMIYAHFMRGSFWHRTTGRSFYKHTETSFSDNLDYSLSDSAL